MQGGTKSLSNKTRREVKFSSGGGKFFVHPSLVCDQPCDEVQRDALHQESDNEHEVDLTSSLPPEHPSGHPDNPGEDDPSYYVWRSQDYSFLPVKPPEQVNQALLSYSWSNLLKTTLISLISSRNSSNTEQLKETLRTLYEHF